MNDVDKETYFEFLSFQLEDTFLQCKLLEFKVFIRLFQPVIPRLSPLLQPVTTFPQLVTNIIAADKMLTLDVIFKEGGLDLGMMNLQTFQIALFN